MAWSVTAEQLTMCSKNVPAHTEILTENSTRVTITVTKVHKSFSS